MKLITRFWMLMIGFALGLASCIPADEKVTPVPRVSSESVVEMGEDYLWQHFYDLKENKIVKTVTKMEWDLAISNDDHRVTITNTGRFIFAGASDYKSIEEATDSAGIHMIFDSSNGYHQDLALFDVARSDVFLLDLGFDENDVNLGLIWVEIDSVSNDEYSIRSKVFGENTITTNTLKIGGTSNYSYFSLLKNMQVDIEPDASTYDLVFRQYVYYFEVEQLPYYVAGVLINNKNVRAYETNETEISFETFSQNDVDESRFGSRLDAIGYDWKFFDFTTQGYVVLPEKIYVIQDVDGFYYALRFTGFYSEKGEKGSPAFEVKLL